VAVAMVSPPICGTVSPGEVVTQTVLAVLVCFGPAVFVAWRVLRQSTGNKMRSGVVRIAAVALLFGAAGALLMGPGNLFTAVLVAAIGAALVLVTVLPGFILDVYRARKSPRATYVGVGITSLAILVVIPNLVGTRIASNDTSAVASCVMYLSAQQRFHKMNGYKTAPSEYANPKRGSYADLYRIGYDSKEEGDLIGLIDRSLAVARANSADPRPKAGYLMQDIVFADPTTEFGLCAFPSDYGRSGTLTFIVDARGGVYQRDTKGKPVTSWPDLKAEGWIAVGSN